MKHLRGLRVTPRSHWRLVERRLTNAERKLTLEGLFKKSSLLNFEIDYVACSQLANLKLPQGISHWECEMRLMLESGTSVGYYLAGVARFSEHRETSVHVAALFNMDGSVRSAFRTPARCAETGLYFPESKPQKQWSDGQEGNMSFAILIDSILNSASRPPRKGRTR